LLNSKEKEGEKWKIGLHVICFDFL
jgi:hypothetical protein